MKTIYTELDLNALSLKAIGDIYNAIAVELDVKQVPRFSGKPAAIKRTLKLQAELPVEQEVKVEAVKVETSPKSKFNTAQTISILRELEPTLGTIENSIYEAIVAHFGYDENDNEVHSIVENVITHVIENHKRPRSEQVVDAAYVIHNIKWFVKAGSFELN